MKFRLSNRQQKELVIRGQSLTVAVPWEPTWWEADESDIRRMIPELPSDVEITVYDAEEIAVVYEGTTGSAAELGSIVDEDNPDPSLDRVWIVAAKLTPMRCRGEVKRLQWPGVILR